MIRLGLAFLVAGAALFGARHHLFPCCARSDAPATGRYVEARTASVLAGACHYNGELVTAGREALLAWRFDGGVEAGVELAGLAAVAVVRADENLELAGERRAIVYVPAGLAERERGALLAAVRRHAAGALGDLREVREAELSVRFDGDAYGVLVPGEAELSGALDADRACCRMPQNVWYAPLAPIEGRIVGTSETFEFSGRGFGDAWTRHGANDAFVGTFGGACAALDPREGGCCVPRFARSLD